MEIHIQLPAESRLRLGSGMEDASGEVRSDCAPTAAQGAQGATASTQGTESGHVVVFT